MRISRAIWGVALAATLTLFASGLRADEYNKLTYLTFSGPVQVPGVVLDAGTYMFKLADPEGSRRVIQIWDKEGTKLYTTLLTISDQQAEPKDDPVVLFKERPSGEPQAVKSWFYVGETHGYEFVYPKDQAMKIAQANHERVLATSTSGSTDYATISKSSVGHVNDTGQFDEERQAEAKANNEDTAARNDQTAAAQAPRDEQAPQNAQANQSAQDQSARPATPAPAEATQPSANRTESGVTRPDTTAANSAQSTTTSSTSARSTTAQSTTAQARPSDPNRAVGTSGQLPKTASNGPLIQLLAGLSFIAAFGVRQLRRRAAIDRA